ncbi:SO_0444 family Cu/Zn efflux transporter [Desulfocurvus sp. DL9XJH121]
MTYITDFLLQTWILLNEAAPWVLLGFLVAGLIKALVPDDFIAKHLGKPGMGSVLKASALGVPIPLCSCGVVPAAAGLRRQGAGKGATAAFMISTPETGADSMAVTWALLDPVMTVVRPVAAFITAMAAGAAINLWADKDKSGNEELNQPVQSCCGGNCSCDSAPAAPSLGARLRGGLEHAFGDMLQDIGRWLILGLILAGAVSAFVPDDFFHVWLGNEWASLGVMLLAGIPLYICATSSTPIAATMALKGLSPGAALVFLLAGPATNAATVAVASRILGKRATAIYVAAIALCSLGLGWLVNRLYAALGLDVTAWVLGADQEAVTWFSMACSVLLLALILRPSGGHTSHQESCCQTKNNGDKHIHGHDFVVK